MHPKQITDAILLVGPTGSGKTPLGDAIGVHGIQGKKAAHFDFGEQLRIVTSVKSPLEIESDDIDYLKRILAEGKLLENETFYLAEHILSAYAKANSTTQIHPLPKNSGARATWLPSAKFERLTVNSTV